MTANPSRRTDPRRWVKRLLLIAITLTVLTLIGPPVARALHQWIIDQRVDRYQDLIQHYAQENDLPTKLVRAVIVAESGGRPKAVSRVGARGLMQIMPAAESDVLRLRQWEQGDLFDPAYNIQIGSAYLNILSHRFDGDATLTAAAYHMGAARTQELREQYPNPSSRDLIAQQANAATRAYVRKVLAHALLESPPQDDQSP